MVFIQIEGATLGPLAGGNIIFRCMVQDGMLARPKAKAAANYLGIRPHDVRAGNVPPIQLADPVNPADGGMSTSMTSPCNSPARLRPADWLGDCGSPMWSMDVVHLPASLVADNNHHRHVNVRSSGAVALTFQTINNAVQGTQANWNRVAAPVLPRDAACGTLNPAELGNSASASPSNQLSDCLCAAVPVRPAGLAYANPDPYLINAVIPHLDKNVGFTLGAEPILPRPDNGPAVQAAIPVFTVAPALPAGLVINAATGQITGTPTVASASTLYSVTATTRAGAVTATVQIEVQGRS